jgi:hypothetical protein
MVREVVQLRLGRQFAVKNQIGGLQERALFGDLLDWITAVAQYAFVAVNVSNPALTRRRVHEAGVVTDDPFVFRDFDLEQIRRLDGTVFDWDLVLFSGPVIDNR